MQDLTPLSATPPFRHLLSGETGFASFAFETPIMVGELCFSWRTRWARRLACFLPKWSRPAGCFKTPHATLFPRSCALPLVA